jgi:hypothetical protein
VPFDVDCPEPFQNLLHRRGFVLLKMGVLAIKNSVTCKIRFIGKQDYSQKIKLIDVHLNHPLTKLLPVHAINNTYTGTFF